MAIHRAGQSDGRRNTTSTSLLSAVIVQQWIRYRRLSATLAGLLPSGLCAYGFTRAGSIVEDEISLAFINDHRYVRAINGCTPTVRHCAVRIYRIGSRECGRLNVVSADSYEKLSGEVALSVEGEAADRSEIRRRR